MFVEISTFYFNIFLENIYSENEELYEKFLKTMVGYFLQQHLYNTDFNNMNLAEFCKKYNDNNLLDEIKSDYLNAKKLPKVTDIKFLQTCVEQRVTEFYNIKN